MIGRIEPRFKVATIVGGGISGLLTAYSLDQQGFEVTLMEAAPRAGGMISTLETPFGISESAAHSFLASSSVRLLCSELGVELVSLQKDSQSRFILRNGKLRRFPLGPLEMLQTAFQLMKRSQFEPKTLQEWGVAHLGERATAYLLSPFLQGIYGALPEEIGVSAAFPFLKIPQGESALSHLLKIRMKQRANRSPMMAPEQGMIGLVSALESYLKTRLGDRYRCGTKVDTLPTSPNLILAVDAHSAAQLLQTESPRASEALSRVTYCGLVSVTAFMERMAFKKSPRGVGVLIPQGERKNSLGILWNSSSFERRVRDPHWVSFTAMLAGKPWLDATDAEIRRAVAQDLEQILGARSAPREQIIHRWKKAIPIYSPELPTLWNAVKESWAARPGRVLVGNYTGQVSIRGMIEDAAKGLVG